MARVYQVEDSREYCEKRGYQIIEFLVIAEVASPSTLQREGLQRILEAAKKDEFDVLVSWEFGCLSGSTEDLDYIFKLFDKHGIRYETVKNF